MSHPAPADGSRFADDWLAAREPVDHRSRAHGLSRFAAAHLRRCAGNRARVIDLGAGRGSNLRYLAGRLDGPIDWHLLDHDADLLAAVVRDGLPTGRDHDRLTIARIELAEPLAPLLAGADLVTAAALLDLASRAWIDAFVAACAEAGAAVLVALSVDGRILFSAPDADDNLIRAAVAADQGRDKGLGVALGTAAPAALVDALARYGYAVISQPSDWHLDRRDIALARPLIEDWRDAGYRQRPAQAERIAAWAARRVAAIEDSATRLRVGHVDILGLPNRRRCA